MISSRRERELNRLCYRLIGMREFLSAQAYVAPFAIVGEDAISKLRAADDGIAVRQVPGCCDADKFPYVQCRNLKLNQEQIGCLQLMNRSELHAINNIQAPSAKQALVNDCRFRAGID
jgi:hypothetical protein